MRISFIDKLSKMVPQSETKAKILASCWDNKDLGTMKLRFRDNLILEIENHLWLDASCQNQNLEKNLLAEKTLLADQRQS